MGRVLQPIEDIRSGFSPSGFRIRKAARNRRVACRKSRLPLLNELDSLPQHVAFGFIATGCNQSRNEPFQPAAKDRYELARSFATIVNDQAIIDRSFGAAGGSPSAYRSSRWKGGRDEG